MLLFNKKKVGIKVYRWYNVSNQPFFYVEFHRIFKVNPQIFLRNLLLFHKAYQNIKRKKDNQNLNLRKHWFCID